MGLLGSAPFGGFLNGGFQLVMGVPPLSLDGLFHGKYDGLGVPPFVDTSNYSLLQLVASGNKNTWDDCNDFFWDWLQPLAIHLKRIVISLQYIRSKTHQSLEI